MAMRSEHVFVGAGIGLVGALVRCKHRSNKPEFRHVAVGVGLGAAGALLPDLLEPAFHPGHRQLCHSVLLAVALGLFIMVLMRRKGDGASTNAIEAMIDGYLSHLALDAVTPAGLPLLGLGG